MTQLQDESDADLLARASAGDDSGFALLYRRHVAACRQRARRILATDEWVDDVVQIVFLDVWRHAARFDPARSRGDARGWLLVLTHHKAVSVVREQERYRLRHAQERMLVDQVDLDPGPEEVVAAADARARLRTAVAQVRAPQQQAVALCYLAGMSQRKAAAALHVPLGTLKTRSRRGVHELRELVDRSLL